MTDKQFDKDTYPTPLSVFNPINDEFRFIVGGRIKFLSPDTNKWTDVCRGNHLAIFDPKHRNMGQVIRHVHIDDFGALEWRANSRKRR